MPSFNPRRTPQAGRRPHPVQVLRVANTTHETSGEWLQAFAPLDPANPLRFATVRPMLGRELLNAREVQADVTTVVEMPWDPVMGQATPKMVIDHGSRRLQIVSVLNVEERNITLHFLCKEAV